MTPAKDRPADEHKQVKEEKKKRKGSIFRVFSQRSSRKSRTDSESDIAPVGEAETGKKTEKKRKGSFRKVLSSVGRRLSRKSRSDSESDTAHPEERKRKGSRIGNFFRRHSWRKSSRSESEADAVGLPGVTTVNAVFGDSDDEDDSAIFTTAAQAAPPPSADDARAQVSALTSRMIDSTASEQQPALRAAARHSDQPSVEASAVMTQPQYTRRDAELQTPHHVSTRTSRALPAAPRRSPSSMRAQGSDHCGHPDVDFGEPTRTKSHSSIPAWDHQTEPRGGSSSRDDALQQRQLAREALERKQARDLARKQSAREELLAQRPPAKGVMKQPTQEKELDQDTTVRSVRHKRPRLASPNTTSPAAEEVKREKRGLISRLFGSIFTLISHALSRIFQVLTCQPAKSKRSTDDRELGASPRDTNASTASDVSASRGWFSGYQPSCALPCAGGNKKQGMTSLGEVKKKSCLSC